jgi:hypothetical protein
MPPLHLARCAPAPSWASSNTRVPNASYYRNADTCRVVDLLEDPLDEEPPRPRPQPRPRPLAASPPFAPLSDWFSASRFFLRAPHSSSVRYSFPSCFNDVDASSNASSTSFNRHVRSATDIVDTSNNVLIVIVIYLKRGGRDQSIFVMISSSFTSSPRVVRCAAQAQCVVLDGLTVIERGEVKLPT